MNTKRILVGLAAVAIAVAPVLAHASVFAAKEQYNVSPQTRIRGNVYVASSTISVAGPVDGDVFLAGSNISITSGVSGDVAAVGGTIQILAPVAGDIRTGGGQVSVGSSVGGDVIAAGGTVHILQDAQVLGDVYVAGGQVIIDGIVNGTVHMRGGSLTVNGQILGALSYASSKPAQINPGAKVVGKVSYTPTTMPRHPGSKDRWPSGALFALIGIITALKTIALLGAAALVVWRWRRQAGEVAQDVKDHFWTFVGRGIVYTILVPIAAFMLLISFVGSIVGIGAFLIYGGVMLAAKVFSGLLLGAWLSALVYKKSAVHVTWLNALAGVVLLEVFSLIPIVGWILKAFICLAAFGILAHRTQEAVRRM